LYFAGEGWETEIAVAVIGVEPAVKCFFVLKGMQTRLKGQYNAELTLSPRLYVKPLITPITAIGSDSTAWQTGFQLCARGTPTKEKIPGMRQGLLGVSEGAF